MPTDQADQTMPDDNRDYNRVLEYHVEEQSPDELDLVGLIAYSLYKRQKRDWLVKHRSSHSGRLPSAEAVAAVTSSYLTEDLRNTLRNRASDLLSSYADTYVEALEPGIRVDAITSETLRQARDIELSLKNRSNFWSQVGTGLVATVIWTLLVTGLIVTASLFGSDIMDAWNAFRAPSAVN